MDEALDLTAANLEKVVADPLTDAEQLALTRTELAMARRVNDNLQTALSDLSGTVEHLYADAAPVLSPTNRAHWMVQLGAALTLLRTDRKNVSFGAAVELLKRGHRVRRRNWNGKNMWLAYVATWACEATNLAPREDGTRIYTLLPIIVMKTADDCLVPWLASQTDVLAGDWEVAT